MNSYHDDNFGHWENTDDPEVRKFYDQVQSESVLKECRSCGQQVYLRPDYGTCDSCCRRMESGWEY